MGAPGSPEMDWKLVLDLLEEYGNTRYINQRLATWREEHRNPLTREPEPWTQVDLSNAMKKMGFPGMNKSVIWKMENPDKPSGRRNITLDEAMAFAKVFGKTLPEILLPPDALQEVDGWKHFMAAADALNDARFAWAQYEHEVGSVRNRIAARPQLRARIVEYQKWARARFQKQARETWENDERGTGVTLAQYAEGFAPTPAMVASQDVLSNDPLPIHPWLNRANPGTSGEWAGRVTKESS